MEKKYVRVSENFEDVLIRTDAKLAFLEEMLNQVGKPTTDISLTGAETGGLMFILGDIRDEWQKIEFVGKDE